MYKRQGRIMAQRHMYYSDVKATDNRLADYEAFQEILAAVSYTHLDVYKRQRYRKGNTCSSVLVSKYNEAFRKGVVVMKKIISVIVVAVLTCSFTMLCQASDMYDKQAGLEEKMCIRDRLYWMIHSCFMMTKGLKIR